MPVNQRLPLVNGDDGQWGEVLNQYIEKEHYNTGVDDPSNGGHKTITVRPGTTAAGTAPIKLASGPVMTVPEAGAIEFNTDKLYFTQTTGSARLTLAAYNDTSGATGDVYYRDASANFIRLPIGTATNVLSVSGGVPAWQARTAHTPTAVWGDSVNSGSVSAGTVSFVRVPYSGTITSWHLLADVATSCVIDVWKAAGSVPTVANTITASSKPTLTSATTATSSTLTGWTTTVTAGDVLGFNLQTLSSGTPKSITLVLNVA